MSGYIDKPVIIIGYGGHAKVLIDTLQKTDCKIIGFIDPNAEQGRDYYGVKCLGNDENIDRYNTNDIELVNGIGALPGLIVRRELAKKMRGKGFRFAKVIHPSSIIANNVNLDEGVQVMAGAVFQPGVSIGKDSIINTSVNIDHDCKIGNDVHLAPGVTLSGDVIIEDQVHVGTGASIVQNIEIGNSAIISAGAVVYHNIPAGIKYIQRREELFIREDS